MNRLVSAWALVACLGAPALAPAASIQGPRRSALERLEEGDAIRNRLLLRGGRFELSPALGFTLNDAFQRNVLFGLQLGYHLNDDWGLGITALGGLALDSNLAERIQSERPEKVKQGAFSSVGVLGTFEATYTPIIGKFALFGRHVLNYDLHVLAGAGATLLKGSADLEGATPTAVLGAGLRTFVSGGFAVNLQVRDYIYSAALNEVKKNGESQTDASFSNNFALTVGAAFYFPQEPKISD